MYMFLSILQVVFAVFIIVVVLMQSGRQAGLSGSIAGGAETFFGKNKAKTWEAILDKLTIIVAAVFGVVALLLNLLMV